MDPIYAKIIPLDPGMRPDHGLPPIPGAPDNTLPPSPPGIWPPMSPGRPIQPLPPIDTTPPGTIWPSPGLPDNSLPTPPPGVDNTLPPAPPGSPDQGLPKPQKYWVVAGIPGIGWRYICVDPSLKPQPK